MKKVFCLMLVLLLPWFSLLVSIPAMLRFRCESAGPSVLETGELWLLGTCALPMPPFRGRLRLRRFLTGESWCYQGPGDLPTDHCGGYAVTVEKLRICAFVSPHSRKGERTRSSRSPRMPGRSDASSEAFVPSMSTEKPSFIAVSRIVRIKQRLQA